jgi:uncharacterized coiled-coil protein SlyX
MSDDLVKRLREDQPVTQDMVSTMQCALQDAAADRIEELDSIIRHDRERIEELVSMVNSKDARIKELEDKLANIVHTIWTEHKDWEGERKYALRQIVKWLVRAGRDSL